MNLTLPSPSSLMEVVKASSLVKGTLLGNQMESALKGLFQSNNPCIAHNNNKDNTWDVESISSQSLC